ncbi:OLC1v1018422C1 [Oldenlandia corymbosa var. corymbosa]|uniref:RING-type E3 ubiquitin transferase n=1 Tax=Oldenlandia corymbosa var. corymbosa TaxID=529605 RepID=A0AAV1EBV1_OLDCO|nr:OLC1v1018422C1 [Oldenlandia corymbosa var. corymbosa]
MVSVGERNVLRREEIIREGENNVNDNSIVGVLNQLMINNKRPGDHDQDQDQDQEQDQNQDRMDVVEELINIVEQVKCIGEYRRTQRKECQSLLRRLKLLSPFLEEVKDMVEEKKKIPESAMECLTRLKKAFLSSKKLLNTCHCGSKIYLAIEAEAMMGRFHYVYGKISRALDGMPYDELGISEEEKEQVELMRTQIRRAKKRTDTQDMEFTMDLMVILSTENDRNAEKASIERLANKLALHTAEDLRAETLAVRKLVNERKGHNAESTQQIIDLLNKFKKFAGVPETGILDDPVLLIPKTLEKSASIAIPHEFLCPITLEIMTDPVIVSTGQTYERESIQQWLDSSHRTCPKTGQLLTHTTLVPNFALKNLIHQWCTKNNFHLPAKETAPESPSKNPNSAFTGNEEERQILTLVQNLSSSQLDVQRKAVAKIRMLSKESPENRILIATSGGVRPLVELLTYPDSKIREHAVTAILNLSIDESNKKLISKEEPIPAIIDILENGTVGAKENSAATLFSLSMLDENKVKIGELNGIPPLILLLKSGTIRGKKDAVTALFNLCLNHTNKSMAIEAGIIPPLINLLEDKNLDMVDEILSIILLLALSQDGRQQLGQLSFIETLVNLIKDGTPKNKECATAVLLELCSKNSNLILAALQYGVYQPLADISDNGTNRGRRKANSLMQLMRESEHL